MKYKSITLSILSIIAVTLYPICFLYFNNIGKVLIKEIMGISGLILLIGIGVFVGTLFLTKNSGKAALITNLSMGFLLYFVFFERAIIKILPMLYYWHIVLICLFLIAHLGYLIHRRMSSTKTVQINLGLLVIFTGLILYNGAVMIPQALSVISQTRHESSTNQLKQNDTPNSSPGNIELPNVYFFIFDEYAGYDGILRYCGYDNIDFYNSLEALGFATSKHSINGSGDTYTEIPNLLQLNAINKVDMTSNNKKENFKNPYLFILMKQNGYSINLLDSTNYRFLDQSYADHLFTTDFVSTYRTFNSYVIQNTIYYPFYGSNDQDNEINEMEKMFAYAQESSSLQTSNLLTVGYFNFPHLPYIVDENGNKTNDVDRTNLSDPVPYLRQFKYANKKILEMVKGILENDPDSIIILQSDHGYRLPSHLWYWYGIHQYDLKTEAPFEQNILDAVYYRGQFVDIEGLSGLNTMKVVLNQLLDAGLVITK